MSKRFGGWLAMSSSVPAVVFFALAARPARLYAESAVAPTMCTDPNIEACAGKTVDDTCTFTFGDDASSNVDRFCKPSTCVADGGKVIATLECRYVAPCVEQTQVDDCAGKSPGDGCADGGRCSQELCPILDGATWDGGAALACIPPSPPLPNLDATPDTEAGAETETTNAQGCTCDSAASAKTGFGAFAGLMLALAAVLRRRRLP